MFNFAILALFRKPKKINKTKKYNDLNVSLHNELCLHNWVLLLTKKNVDLIWWFRLCQMLMKICHQFPDVSSPHWGLFDIHLGFVLYFFSSHLIVWLLLVDYIFLHVVFSIVSHIMTITPIIIIIHQMCLEF